MKHRHSHVVLLIISSLVVVFVFGLYGYMRHTVAESLNRALDVRLEVQKQESYKKQGQELTTIYNQTKDDRARLQSFFVPHNGAIAFIETLESLGDRAGTIVTLSSIDADDLDTKPVGTTGSVRANLDVKGPWSGVMKTLLLVETLPYQVSLDQLQIRTSGTPDAKGGSPEWNASFRLTVLMIKKTP